jgi:hypothetical protein
MGQVHQSRVTIHGHSRTGLPTHELSAAHVPAGVVDLPSGRHTVGDNYVTDPVHVSHVHAWVKQDGEKPFVRFAMETAKSPHRPGELHVVQMGASPNKMEDIAPILDYKLGERSDHLELVGQPIQILARYMNWEKDPELVMGGLNFWEQVALGAHLNRMSVEARADAHLGALTLLSVPEIMHAGLNHRGLFIGEQNFPGLPRFIGNITRDLANPAELALPASLRQDARRAWRGGAIIGGGTLPVTDSDRDYGGFPYNRSEYNIARFGIKPL